MAKSSATKTVKTPQTVVSVMDFIEKVSDFAKKGSSIKCYRGQRNSIWENVPGLFRADLKRLEANEKRAVRDLISVHPNEFYSDDTMFDRLVRMQHFGLPTRLMDVSLNPLVALYFATESLDFEMSTIGVVTAFSVPEEREKYYDSDTVSCLANLANLTRSEKEQIIDLRRNRLKGVSKGDEIKNTNDSEVYKRLIQFIKSEKRSFSIECICKNQKS